MSALSETIAGQPAALQSVLGLDLSEPAARLAGCRRFLLVGTGTSQHAAELGAAMFAGGAAEVQWRSSAGQAWNSPRLSADDGVVVISHTAETAFARRARACALERGARVVSITGIGCGWPDAIETVARERSETYTVSYLAALLVLARLAVALGLSPFDESQLQALPDRVRAATEAPPVLPSPPRRMVVLAGAGPGSITAREGALKLREAARVLADGYEAEYLLHGSAVPLTGEDVFIAVDPGSDRFGLLDGLAHAASQQGIHVATVEEPGGIHPLLIQFPLTVRLQVLASTLADARGHDPDRVITGPWAADRLWQAGAPS